MFQIEEMVRTEINTHVIVRTGKILRVFSHLKGRGKSRRKVNYKL